ncbi:dipeptidase [bacterium]|nr:dipeptidase [bacterium]
MKKILIGLLVLITVGIFLMSTLGVKLMDQSMNLVVEHEPYTISDEASELHASLIVGDWHADTALWNRDMQGRHDFGHVDLARMQEGNLGIQMFTTVTKSPAGQNYDSNETSARDNITMLAMAQLWPVVTWSSLTERALFQAAKVRELAEKRPSDFALILTKSDLSDWQMVRGTNQDFAAGLIGTEGSHALDGKLDNIDVLYDAGFRMMSLQHFFDNALGGSLHGTSQAGLTAFGKQAVEIMQAKDIIVDVSHSSEATVRDVLAQSTAPLVVSHTGFKGHCDTPRNIADELMLQIAEAGGLIAVGFWPGAVCGTSPESVIEAIEYGVALVGEDHVALGSDFDGTVETSFDSSEMAVLTQTMLDRNMPESAIRKVMGGNMVRFLSENLPD